MDEYLKFLEAHCPGDDAHDGLGDKRPLLERCDVCASLYEGHQKVVSSKLESATQELTETRECLGRETARLIRERDDIKLQLSESVDALERTHSLERCPLTPARNCVACNVIAKHRLVEKRSYVIAMPCGCDSDGKKCWSHKS